MENILNILQERKLTPQRILSCVAMYFEISEETILGSTRQANIVYARQITMYLYREMLSLSYPVIGKILGGKNHATVIHSINKIKNMLVTNIDTNNTVTQIKTKCLNL